MPHIHDLIDFVVNIYIVYNNKVLLIFHRQLNLWLPIGGHIELNEDPEEALFREVKEECGLEIEVLSNKPDVAAKGVKFLYTPSFLDIHEISNNHKHAALTYLARAKSDKFIFNKEEHKDIRWFSEKDLENHELNIMLHVKFYSRQALSRF